MISGLGAAGARVVGWTDGRSRLRPLRRLSHAASATSAPHAGTAASRGRSPSRGGRPGRPPVRARGNRRAGPDRSMPGQVQHTVDSLLVEAKRLVSLGVPGLILFGVPARKDAGRERGVEPQGVVQVALRACATPSATSSCSWRISAWTSTPTTGTAASRAERDEVHNDVTLERYRRIAVAQAEAGAHMVAPSGMMDGQVAAILPRSTPPATTRSRSLPMRRSTRPPSMGFPRGRRCDHRGGGDRRAYQQDPPNPREALPEIAFDVAEGADMVMVKPALTKLDILAAGHRDGAGADRGVPGQRRVRDGQGGGGDGVDRRAAVARSSWLSSSEPGPTSSSPISPASRPKPSVAEAGRGRTRSGSRGPRGLYPVG